METLENTVAVILSEIDYPSPIRPVWRLGSAIEQAMVRLEQAGQIEPAHALLTDWAACRMVVRNMILWKADNGSSTEESRLSGYRGYRDGGSYPDPGRLTPEDKEYLDRRARETRNPVLRAHYNDVLWETAKGDAAWKQRRHRIAQEAIDAYLESACLFFAAGGMGRDMVEALDHAAHLAMKMRKAPGGSALLTRVIETVDDLLGKEADRDLAEASASHPRGRWVVDLARLLARVRQKIVPVSVPNKSIQRARELCEQFAELHSATDPWSEVEFRRAVVDLARAQGDWASVYSASVSRIQAIEREAEARRRGPAGDPLAAAGILQHALQEYEKLAGNPDIEAVQRAELVRRVAALRSEIRELYREGRDRHGVVAVPLEVSREEVESLLRDLLSPDDIHDCLDRISSDGSLLPDLKLAEDEAHRTMEHPGAFQYMPSVRLSDDIPVADAPAVRALSAGVGDKGKNRSTANEDAEASDSRDSDSGDNPNKLRYEFERDRNLLLWIGINSQMVLHELFERLKERKGLTPASLIEHLDRWGLLDEDNREILAAGIDRYFAGDGIGAMHILAVQFEDVFRSILDKAGAAFIRERRRHPGWQFETNLRSLMALPEAAAVSEEIRHYIRLVFVDPKGWNLRNRVAHGLIQPAQCALPMVETVLHLFLLLTLIRIDSP